MGRKPSVNSPRAELCRALDNADAVYQVLKPFLPRNGANNVKQLMHPSRARRVLALTFIQVVAAWESYVEALLVRFVAGAKNSNGQPVLTGTAQTSLLNAYRTLSGRATYDPTRHFLKVTAPNDILAYANAFVGKAPFDGPINQFKQAIEDATAVRNRTAHDSKKCRTAFNAVAARLGNFRKGYSTGDLLCEPVHASLATQANGHADFAAATNTFEWYLCMYRHIAKVLVP